MKRLFKFFLFFLLSVGFVIPGCVDPCNCPDVAGVYFDIESVELGNFRALEDGSKEEIHNENIEVSWEAYRLQGKFDVSFFGYTEPTFNFDFSLMPTAYGCSFISDGYKGSLEKFSEFKVITRNDFDENHLANDTLNSLLNISIGYNYEMDLNEFLESDTSNIRDRRFELTLKSPPILSDEFEVDILIRLDNGDEFLTSNGAVKLN